MLPRDGQHCTAPLDEVRSLAERFQVLSAQSRELDVRRAKALVRIEELDGWVCAGSSSVCDFGERYGVPAKTARELLEFGRALKEAPYLEEEVCTGRITVEAAALLGRVLPDPTLQREGDDWVGLARTKATKSLRLLVKKRIEETRIGEGLAVTITVFVADQTREDFHRAQVIASRKAGEFQTESQTFKTLTDHFLDDFDEQRVTPGKRRLPHTAMVNGRHVPEEVKREVFARQGERCAVPFCEFDIYLNFAHLVPHGAGGHREADNQVLLCWWHHYYFDHGFLRMAGTAAKPTFFDREGRDLTYRFPYAYSQHLIDPEGVLGAPSNGALEKRAGDAPARPPGAGNRSEAGADPPAIGADPP